MSWLRRCRSGRGQSVVEFALILPVIMTLTLGMIEMGFAINHNTSIVTATRQGARVGASLVNGSPIHHCTDNTAAGIAGAAAVDAQIVAATEGVLRSPGSPINVSQVSKIEIIELDGSTGAETGKKNTWISAVNTDGTPRGDVIPGTSTKLYFKANGGNYTVGSRCGTSPAKGIEVRITYTYLFITPLGALISTVFPSSSITMTDHTTMALEPPLP
jgi:Flp pilus assembly protein TadG